MADNSVIPQDLARRLDPNTLADLEEVVARLQRTVLAEFLRRLDDSTAGSHLKTRNAIRCFCAVAAAGDELERCVASWHEAREHMAPRAYLAYKFISALLFGIFHEHLSARVDLDEPDFVLAEETVEFFRGVLDTLSASVFRRLVIVMVSQYPDNLVAHILRRHAFGPESVVCWAEGIITMADDALPDELCTRWLGSALATSHHNMPAEHYRLARDILVEPDLRWMASVTWLREEVFATGRLNEGVSCVPQVLRQIAGESGAPDLLAENRGRIVAGQVQLSRDVQAKARALLDALEDVLAVALVMRSPESVLRFARLRLLAPLVQLAAHRPLMRALLDESLSRYARQMLLQVVASQEVCRALARVPGGIGVRPAFVELLCASCEEGGLLAKPLPPLQDLADFLSGLTWTARDAGMLFALRVFMLRFPSHPETKPAAPPARPAGPVPAPTPAPPTLGGWIEARIAAIDAAMGQSLASLDLRFLAGELIELWRSPPPPKGQPPAGPAAADAHARLAHLAAAIADIEVRVRTKGSLTFGDRIGGGFVDPVPSWFVSFHGRLEANALARQLPPRLLSADGKAAGKLWALARKCGGRDLLLSGIRIAATGNRIGEWLVEAQKGERRSPEALKEAMHPANVMGVHLKTALNQVLSLLIPLVGPVPIIACPEGGAYTDFRSIMLPYREFSFLDHPGDPEKNRNVSMLCGFALHEAAHFLARSEKVVRHEKTVTGVDPEFYHQCVNVFEDARAEAILKRRSGSEVVCNLIDGLNHRLNRPDAKGPPRSRRDQAQRLILAVLVAIDGGMEALSHPEDASYWDLDAPLGGKAVQLSGGCRTRRELVQWFVDRWSREDMEELLLAARYAKDLHDLAMLEFGESCLGIALRMTSHSRVAPDESGSMTSEDEALRGDAPDGKNEVKRPKGVKARPRKRKRAPKLDAPNTDPIQVFEEDLEKKKPRIPEALEACHPAVRRLTRMLKRLPPAHPDPEMDLADVGPVFDIPNLLQVIADPATRRSTQVYEDDRDVWTRPSVSATILVDASGSTGRLIDEVRVLDIELVAAMIFAEAFGRIGAPVWLAAYNTGALCNVCHINDCEYDVYHGRRLHFQTARDWRVLGNARHMGGNNDADAIRHATRNWVFQCETDVHLLVLINDGCPTHCSLDSVCDAVRELNTQGGKLVYLNVRQTKVEPASWKGHPEPVFEDQYFSELAPLAAWARCFSDPRQLIPEAARLGGRLAGLGAGK